VLDGDRDEEEELGVLGFVSALPRLDLVDEEEEDAVAQRFPSVAGLGDDEDGGTELAQLAAMAGATSNRENDSSVRFWGHRKEVESIVEGGEWNEYFTRNSKNTSGRPEVDGGGRKSRRSAAAGDENVDLGVDTERPGSIYLYWQNEDGVVVLTVVLAWLGLAGSNGATSRRPWRFSAWRGSRGKKEGTAALVGEGV
jgi:hypothetical protein